MLWQPCLEQVNEGEVVESSWTKLLRANVFLVKVPEETGIKVQAERTTFWVSPGQASKY